MTSKRDAKLRDIQWAFRNGHVNQADVAWLLQEIENLEMLIPSDEEIIQTEWCVASTPSKVDILEGMEPGVPYRNWASKSDPVPEASSWLLRVRRLTDQPGRQG